MGVFSCCLSMFCVDVDRICSQVIDTPDVADDSHDDPDDDKIVLVPVSQEKR